MNIYENGENWIIEDYLNLKLINEIKLLISDNLNKFLELKKNYSTTGKNAKQYWLISRKNSYYFENLNFESIKKNYKNEILFRLKKSNLFHEKNLKIVNIEYNNCWTVIGQENTYHTVHNHNCQHINGISTILYLNVPETNLETDPENKLFLLMNCNPKNSYYYTNPSIININPEVGKLLIFPDWINHGTYPQTKGIRQTFNIDYYLTFEKDKNLFYK